MEKQSFFADSLYVLKPSIIIDIDEMLVSNDKRTNYTVAQTVFFEKQMVPVIAYFTGREYHDVFNLNGSILSSSHKKYFSESILHHNGVPLEAREDEYIDVFDGDITLLSDYLYAKDLNNNMALRLKFFKYPFKRNNMELKDKYSKELLNEKKIYTKDELTKLSGMLKFSVVKPEITKRKYMVLNIPDENRFIYDNFNRFNSNYALPRGTYGYGNLDKRM